MRAHCVRPHLLLTLLISLVLLAGCGDLDLNFGPLLHNVSVAPELISPNADGSDDVTEIRYSLRRSADVSISFTDAAGDTFYFRQDRRRAPGDYDVLWGGVIDQPYTFEGEGGPQEVQSWVLPDGSYTWAIQATEDGGHTEAISGTITLAEGDAEVPRIDNFAVVPDVFRPNQDGLLDDGVSIGFYLTKDVDSLLVYLTDPDDPDTRYFITEEPGVVEPTERGYHDYRYEGGVNLGAEPPPDGEYILTAEARDLAGNAVKVERPLTIEEGGKPRADVVGGEIDWQSEMNRVVFVPLDGKLCFTAVVANESAVPIRTSGPWPGAEYRFGENSNTLAVREEEESWLQQSGVWRFGINFDTTGVDFPYRWAVGRQEDLERRVVDGEEQWYLMPGKRGQVSGCIIMDEVPPVGTRLWWGGLIHQAVEVANNNIDRITVEVGAP